MNHLQLLRRVFCASSRRAAGFLALLLLAAGCARPLPPDAGDRAPASGAAVAALGVEVQALRLTANGYMLDLRYRVLDSDKAMPLMDRKVPVTLVHESTGARFAVPSSPKVGPLRQTVRNSKPTVGRVYFVMFANPGHYVKRGDLVTVVVGNQRIEHLKVE